MAYSDDAALRVVYRDDEPFTAETIDAGDPGSLHLKVACFFFVPSNDFWDSDQAVWLKGEKRLLFWAKRSTE